jgi:chromosome segregation ATPase
MEPVTARSILDELPSQRWAEELSSTLTLNDTLSQAQPHGQGTAEPANKQIDTISCADIYTSSIHFSQIRTELHVEAIAIRDALQGHVRAAMQNGDELLDKIRGIAEELDIARHARILAEEQYAEAEKQRDEAQRQLKRLAGELKTVRESVADLVRQRDKAFIQCEASRGQLLEKNREIEGLVVEARRLKTRITMLETSCVDWKKSVTTAEADVRRLKGIVEETERKHETLLQERNELLRKKQVSDSQMLEQQRLIKELSQSLETKSQELKSSQDAIAHIQKSIRDVREELERATREKNEAVTARQQVEKDRDVAWSKEKEAVRDRNAAREERDAAVQDKDDTCRRFGDLQIQLQDVKQTLTLELQLKQSLIKERNDAVKRAEMSCHYKHETIEHSLQLDLLLHEREQTVAKAEQERAQAIQRHDTAVNQLSLATQARETSEAAQRVLEQEKANLEKQCASIQQSLDEKERALTAEKKKLQDESARLAAELRRFQMRGARKHSIWIQDVFYGNGRVSEETRRDVYENLADHAHRKDPEGFSPEITFDKQQSRQGTSRYLVVIYSVEDGPSRTLVIPEGSKGVFPPS